MRVRANKQYWHNTMKQVIRPGQVATVTERQGNAMINLGIASTPPDDTWSYQSLKSEAANQGIKTFRMSKQDLLIALKG